MGELLLSPAELREWAKLCEREHSPHVVIRVDGVFEVTEGAGPVLTIGLAHGERPAARNPYL